MNYFNKGILAIVYAVKLYSHHS